MTNITELAAYVPYHLRVNIKEKDSDKLKYENVLVRAIWPAYELDPYNYIQIHKGICDTCFLDERTTPILRPHSALVERIRIENENQSNVLGLEIGTEFVMAEWVASKLDIEFIPKKRHINMSNLIILEGDKYNLELVFHPDWDIYLYMCKGPINLSNQALIHRALIAMHFNVYGIEAIEKGGI